MKHGSLKLWDFDIWFVYNYIQIINPIWPKMNFFGLEIHWFTYTKLSPKNWRWRHFLHTLSIFWCFTYMYIHCIHVHLCLLYVWASLSSYKISAFSHNVNIIVHNNYVQVYDIYFVFLESISSSDLFITFMDKNVFPIDIILKI